MSCSKSHSQLYLIPEKSGTLEQLALLKPGGACNFLRWRTGSLGWSTPPGLCCPLVAMRGRVSSYVLGTKKKSGYNSCVWLPEGSTETTHQQSQGHLHATWLTIAKVIFSICLFGSLFHCYYLLETRVSLWSPDWSRNPWSGLTLKLSPVLLPQPLKCWDYKPALRHSCGGRPFWLQVFTCKSTRANREGYIRGTSQGLHMTGTWPTKSFLPTLKPPIYLTHGFTM